MQRLSAIGGHVVTTAASGPAGAAAAVATVGSSESPRLEGMSVWFDIMRDMEHLMGDYTRIFDGWQAGGVTGLVIGPLVFDSPDLVKGLTADSPVPVVKERPPSIAFDPDPGVYKAFGVSVPAKSQGAPYAGDTVKTESSDRTEERATLRAMLQDAKARGFKIMIF
eukprot:SAG11_NODE_4669_length_1813_cov_1.649358_2_plen_165_part_01